MISDLIRVLNEHGKRHQLAAVWTSDMVTNLTNQGLPLDRFLLLKKGDHVVACGALWDQRGLRQTVIRGYAWPLSAVRPLVNAIPQWIGIPRLPRIGSILAHAFVSPLAFADGCESMLPECLGAFLSLAREAGVEYLTIALPAQHPHLDTLRRQFRFRTWTSCLYQVSWPGENRWPIQEDRLFLPDVAFL